MAAGIGLDHLLELAVGVADHHLPPLVDALVDARRVRLVLRPEVQLHVVGEGFDGQPLAIQEDLRIQGTHVSYNADLWFKARVLVMMKPVLRRVGYTL